jgi:porphobilinogen synthase
LEGRQTAGSLGDSYARIFESVKLRKRDLIFPIFVYEPGNDLFVLKNDIPGFAKIDLKDLTPHIQRIIDLGITSVIVFGVPRKRDIGASSAFGKHGVVQVTARKIKKEFGGLVNVITDVCTCQYNLSGHCGLKTKARKDARDHIDNDRTLALLSKIAVSHAESGADVVAPSSMMDGQVQQIRCSLDSRGFRNTKIMAYSAKHASSLYSPFRMTAYSKHIHNYTTIDKSSYQIGYMNPRQVIREIEADIREGADMVMVKPSLFYLDIITMIRDCIDFPLVAQNVSGEYAMIKAAATRGWIDEEEWKVNSISAMKRAGANNIISYFSMDITRYLDH